MVKIKRADSFDNLSPINLYVNDVFESKIKMGETVNVDIKDQSKITIKQWGTKPVSTVARNSDDLKIVETNMLHLGLFLALEFIYIIGANLLDWSILYIFLGIILIALSFFAFNKFIRPPYDLKVE